MTPEAEFLAKEKQQREDWRQAEAAIAAAPRVVVTKCPHWFTIGNDTVFLRVRRRPLQAQPSWSWRGKYTSSASHDLVHAVRVDGKPRHRFVLGLGSIKQPPTNRDLIKFWCNAVGRLSSVRWGPRLTDESLRQAIWMIAEKVPLPAAEAFRIDADRGNMWHERARKMAAIVPTLPTEAIAA